MGCKVSFTAQARCESHDVCSDVNRQVVRHTMNFCDSAPPVDVKALSHLVENVELSLSPEGNSDCSETTNVRLWMKREVNDSATCRIETETLHPVKQVIKHARAHFLLDATDVVNRLGTSMGTRPLTMHVAYENPHCLPELREASLTYTSKLVLQNFGSKGTI